MSVEAAQEIWTVVAVYGAVGLLFALPFAFLGASRIDGATKGTGLFFRLLIIPGAALLWPLVLMMWLTGAGANRRDAT